MDAPPATQTASFESLPIEVVVRWVAPHLDANSLAALSQTNSRLRASLLRVRVLTLKGRWAAMFHVERSFRDAVCEMLPRDRLAISLTKFPSLVVADVSHLGGVHTLVLRSSVLVNRLPHTFADIHTIDLSDCASLRDVSCLRGGRVHTLILARCALISDVSALSGCHTLVLERCLSVTDVSSLGRVHTLDLRDMRQTLRGIDALGRVHDLNLCMTSVEDASALGGVHTLDLSHTGISDLSALGRVHTLRLQNCRKVADVSSLTGVHTIDLRGSVGVTDVRALENAHAVCLMGCQVGDVSALKSVHTLDAAFCPISDVSALGRVHTLNLSHCAGVCDVSALGGVHTLDLTCCMRVRDVSALGGLHKLVLTLCEIADYSSLRNVCELEVDDDAGFDLPTVCTHTRRWTRPPQKCAAQ